MQNLCCLRFFFHYANKWCLQLRLFEDTDSEIDSRKQLTGSVFGPGLI